MRVINLSYTGTREEARDYARKEETRLRGPFEWGTFEEDQSGRRSDLKRVAALIAAGSSDRDLIEAVPAEYIKFFRVR